MNLVKTVIPLITIALSRSMGFNKNAPKILFFDICNDEITRIFGLWIQSRLMDMVEFPFSSWSYVFFRYQNLFPYCLNTV